MKIPRKIDDRLKNSIVQIHFESNLPFGTILGYFHSLFKNDLHYTPSRNPIISNGKIIGFEDAPSIIVTQDNCFTISVQDNIITFDLVDGYKGWDIYQENIRKYISPLFEKNVISKISQIGIRYISNFNNICIYEHINAKICLDFIPNNNKGQSRFEFSSGNNLIILNLLSGGINVNVAQNSQESVSIVDIDVIQKTELVSVNELVNTINEIHETEKKIFFSLLKTSFLSTLNPTY